MNRAIIPAVIAAVMLMALTFFMGSMFESATGPSAFKGAGAVPGTVSGKIGEPHYTIPVNSVPSYEEIEKDIAVREERKTQVEQAVAEKKKKADAVHAEAESNANNANTANVENSVPTVAAPAKPGPVPAAKTQTRAIPNGKVIKEFKSKGYLLR